jgi:hypothetical protein
VILHRLADGKATDTTSHSLIAAGKNGDVSVKEELNGKRLTQLRLMLLMRCLENSLKHNGRHDGSEVGANLNKSSETASATTSEDIAVVVDSESEAAIAVDAAATKSHHRCSADADTHCITQQLVAEINQVATEGGATVYTSARSTCEAGAPAASEQSCGAAPAASESAPTTADSNPKNGADRNKAIALGHKAITGLKKACKHVAAAAVGAARTLHPRMWCGSCKACMA